MTRCLLDTDIVNYLLRNRPVVTGRYATALTTNVEFILSPIVHYEMSRYLLLRGATRLQRLYSELVQDWISAELTGQDWEMAAELWAQRHRAGRPIEDADLLIAVTARQAGAILVTNNTEHFEDLGLTIENWMLP